MKKSNQQSLGDAIREFLRTHRLEEKITETRIAASWEKVMGKNITRYTRKLELKNKVLIVYLTSSVLRSELSYGKTKIMEMINREAGEEAVSEIEFR
jgi:predicted nucleic acid-binding Zn ribbon protein